MLPLRRFAKYGLPYRTSTANLGKQIFKRASSNSYNPRCSTNSGEIAGGTRRDLQGNLYRRRLDKGTCEYWRLDLY